MRYIYGFHKYMSTDSSYILGNGTYGVITTKLGSNTCRKLFFEERGPSFIREAYIIKRLSHINGITEIISLEPPTNDDIITVNNLPRNRTLDSKLIGAIVMNKYSLTLRQWLHTNPTYEERYQKLREIIRILSHVHTCGIVHADIKLDNIMLTKNNDIRIIDWGLAGPCGYARIHLTTKTYRPKQIIQDYCHDIYSLGVISIELLLGSIMIGDLDYMACAQLLKSTNLDKKLRKLLCRMIHPNCLKRPDIVEIAQFFELPKPNTISSDVMEIIKIPHEYGIITMEYPVIFSRFILKNPDMINTIYCIIGSIYSCKDPTRLYKKINYIYVLAFLNSL